MKETMVKTLLQQIEAIENNKDTNEQKKIELVTTKDTALRFEENELLGAKETDKILRAIRDALLNIKKEGK